MPRSPMFLVLPLVAGLVVSACGAPTLKVVGPSGASWGYLESDQLALVRDMLTPKNPGLLRMEAFGILRWGLFRYPNPNERRCLAQVSYTQAVPTQTGGHVPVVFYSNPVREECTDAAIDGFLAIAMELDRRDFHVWQSADDQHFVDFIQRRGLVPAAKIRSLLKKALEGVQIANTKDGPKTVLARCNDVVVAGTMDYGDATTWQLWAEAACAANLKGLIIVDDDGYVLPVDAPAMTGINACGLDGLRGERGSCRFEFNRRAVIGDSVAGQLNARYLEFMRSQGSRLVQVAHEITWHTAHAASPRGFSYAVTAR